MKLCQYCNETKKDTRFKICGECYDLHTLNQTKLCTACGTLKDWSNYNKGPGKFSLHSKCKRCIALYDQARENDKEVFLRGLYNSCRSNNKARNKKGRELVFSWTFEEMCAKLKKQKDRCAYSGLMMSFRKQSDWKCSPERIDNNIGYIDSNIIFICFEFQLAWTLQSSCEMVKIICEVEIKSHPRLAEITKGEFTEVDYIPHCSLGRDRCKICRSTLNVYYRNTAQGRLQSLVGQARGHTKERNSRGRDHKINIDYPYALDLLKQQAGTCRLSGHHLSFKSGSYDCISLERIDVNQGYVKGNCCFVMQCLNTTDHSSQTSLANKREKGSGGWTQAKIELLRSSKIDNQILPLENA